MTQKTYGEKTPSWGLSEPFQGMGWKAGAHSSNYTCRQDLIFLWSQGGKERDIARSLRNSLPPPLITSNDQSLRAWLHVERVICLEGAPSSIVFCNFIYSPPFSITTNDQSLRACLHAERVTCLEGAPSSIVFCSFIYMRSVTLSAY